MQKEHVDMNEIKCVGIKVPTSFTKESSLETSEISPCVQKYFHKQLFDKIPNRKKAGVTICAYTDYDTDYQGKYTYFIGEEITSLDHVPDGFVTFTIPCQHYLKMTTEPGSMPDVLKGAWEKIWQMSTEELGGKRNYMADFEIYDERCESHDHVVLDIFLGITKN